MKFEDYESQINSVLSNPDTALAGMGGVMESLKADLTALEELTSTVDELEARIKDLQETNLKLYLSQAGEVEDEVEEEEKSGVDAIEEFWEKLEEE